MKTENNLTVQPAVPPSFRSEGKRAFPSRKVIGKALSLIVLPWMLTFSSCGPDEHKPDTPKNQEPAKVEVTGVSLDNTSLTLEVGATATLKATIQPSNATEKTISWSSSDASVATVSGGTVTAKAPGKAKITASCGGKSSSCEVTVNAKKVDVTSVTLDKESLTLDLDESVTLTATVLPSEATDKTVSWSSSKASVATVENGVVKAVGFGSAEIRAAAGGKFADCKVEVKPSIPLQSITIDGPFYFTIKVGETIKLPLVFTPANASYKVVTWKSDKEEVATVDQEGNVTAISAGEAYINVYQNILGKTVDTTCGVIVKDSQAGIGDPEDFENEKKEW